MILEGGEGKKTEKVPYRGSPLYLIHSCRSGRKGPWPIHLEDYVSLSGSIDCIVCRW